MAITTLKLWMAPESNRLLSGPSSFAPAQNPVFYEGNTARIELHILAGAGVGKVPYEVAFPAGSAIKLAVGQVNAFPTSGTWKLMVESVQTADIPFNATPIQVQAALNDLASVQAAGGVTSALNGDGYTITWNTLGTKPDIGIGSDTLVPSSYESISLVQQGTATNRQVIYVELRQAPVALGVDWDPLPAPVITVSEVTAWNGSTQTWRFNIDPAPKAGSYNLTIAGSLTKSYTLSYSSTYETITTSLSTDFPNTKAYKTGEAQFDIVFQEAVTLTADGNGLIGYLGYIGNVNFSTAEIHQFIGGLASRQTTLEVAIESGGIPQTLIQVNCVVSSDVISNGVLQPLPLGTAISEQVANARFVRRDVTQSPDASTQNTIWLNLGASKFGTDIIGAINNSDSPSVANPFATISDIPNVIPLVWGNIAGTLADQTDLDTALAGKYSTSNPDGYIDLATASLYFYPLTGNPDSFATQAWVIGQNYLTTGSLAGYATESWVNNELTIYATQSWVTGQGYITASALSPYLTSATAASTYAVIAQGLPASGTTGQVLSKVSGADYDATWTSFIPGDRYLTTSTDIATIGNGVKTFTVDTGLSYTATQDVTIAYDNSNHMHATVTTYNPTYGILVVDVHHHTGAGTYAAWTVNVGGVTPLASVAWGAITGTLGSQTDLSTALNDKLNLSGGAMTGAITNTFNGMATEVSEQKFKVGLTSGSLFAELNYQALTISNFGSNMIVTPFGLTFPDATIQTTAGYPNSNPSGFVTSGDVAAYYYPLSNPSGFISDAAGYGSLYARENGGWTAFTIPPAPSYSESVWIYNSWQSATIKNLYDPGSYSYYNVLTF